MGDERDKPEEVRKMRGEEKNRKTKNKGWESRRKNKSRKLGKKKGDEKTERRKYGMGRVCKSGKQKK